MLNIKITHNFCHGEVCFTGLQKSRKQYNAVSIEDLCTAR